MAELLIKVEEQCGETMAQVVRQEKDTLRRLFAAANLAGEVQTLLLYKEGLLAGHVPAPAVARLETSLANFWKSLKE